MAARSRGAQNIVRCTSHAASPPDARGGDWGPLRRTPENKNMKTLLAMAALAAVIASPAFAQTGTRSASRPPSIPRSTTSRSAARRLSRVRRRRAHGLRQQPLSRCRSRSERAPRSAPRLQGPRLLIAGAFSGKVDSGFP